MPFEQTFKSFIIDFCLLSHLKKSESNLIGLLAADSRTFNSNLFPQQFSLTRSFYYWGRNRNRVNRWQRPRRGFRLMRWLLTTTTKKERASPETTSRELLVCKYVGIYQRYRDRKRKHSKCLNSLTEYTFYYLKCQSRKVKNWSLQNNKRLCWRREESW